MKKTVLTEEIDIKQELKQEINLVLDQEEQMYEDQTYWKWVNYFELDGLLKELG